MNNADERKQAKHKAAMKKQKANVDASIEAAETERGVAILLTGNGKGKTSSAFGMVMRALAMGGTAITSLRSATCSIWRSP